MYGLISLNSEKQNDLTELEIEMDIEEAKAKQLSPEKLAEHTQRSVTPKKSQKAESTVYYRSPYIKEMVKQIAEGKCQMCGEEAPFYDKNDEVDMIVLEGIAEQNERQYQRLLAYAKKL